MSSSLPRPTRYFGSGLLPALLDDVEHLDAGRAAQLAELVDASFRILRVFVVVDVDHDRAVLARIGRRDAMRAREPGLDAGDEIEKVELGRQGWLGGKHERLGIGLHARDKQLVRLAGRIDRERGDRVEPQQPEVGEIVAGQRLATQVGVDQAHAAQVGPRHHASARDPAARSSKHRRP